MGSERFYAELVKFDRFIDVPDPVHYHLVPDSWLVIITDVEGSTEAIERGRYKDVNALGAASIMALRNALPEIPIPYVFGGDGATLLAHAAGAMPSRPPCEAPGGWRKRDSVFACA